MWVQLPPIGQYKKTKWRILQKEEIIKKVIEDFKNKKCNVYISEKSEFDFDLLIWFKNKPYKLSTSKDVEADIFVTVQNNNIKYSLDIFNETNFNSILKHFDSNIKVTGPYINGDGRRYVRYVFKNKTQKLTLYSRYLMEQKLERHLEKDETVDHIDRDKTNDVIENLQVLPFKKHVSLDRKRVKYVETECVWCHKKILRSPANINSAHKNNYSGPFCSKLCISDYSSDLNRGIISRFPSQKSIPIEEREYFYLDKNKILGEE